MPFYDYKCKECEALLEDVKQGIKEDRLTTCPKCGKDALERLIGNTSFALKGNGWGNQGYSKE